MYRRIGRLIQVGIFAALPAGMALAQSANTTDDTRTQVQKKAAGVDDQAPSLPNDTSRPGEIPSARDTTSGTPGATMDTNSNTKSDTKSTTDSSSSTATKKSAGDTGDTDTTMEKKTTTRHKHIRKSSQATSPNDFDNAVPNAEPKAKDLNVTPPDDALNHRLDSKGDLDHKDQLNSDK